MEALIVKYLAGEATPEEARQLLDWVALRPENNEDYLRSKKVWEASNAQLQKKEISLPSLNLDDEWNHFVKTVGKSGEKPVIQLESPRGNFLWMKMAAVLLLLIVSGFVVYHFVLKRQDVIYRTANESLALSLPDGSHVTLNSHSLLSYDPSFGRDARHVKLEGEAFFDVVHNAQKPFTVEVARAIIEDVGTAFDVTSYGGDHPTIVIVESGIVKFSVPEIKKEIKLIGGQKAVFENAGKSLQEVINTDPNFHAWSTQKIIFSESDLKTVVETLNRTYRAHITLSTETPASCLVTVTFDHQTLEAVLHVLETTLNLTIEISGDKINITHAGC